MPESAPLPDPAAKADQSKIENPKSKIQRILAYRRLWLTAIVAFGLDQWTKSAVIDRFLFPTYGPPGHYEVIPGFFNFVHVGNTGAAWSILSGHSEWLALLAVLTLVAIFWWRRHLGLKVPFAQWCFGLLCGGIVGNMIDRLRHGHVTDFLDFHFGSYIYPTFNVADSCIVVGVIGYMLWSLRQPAPAE